MNKKYQIFISSTYEDLIEERKIVQETILSMYQFPIGMEMFSADDEEQWEIIQETIDSSDYYVLIIGHRYGTVIDKGEFKGISYTEKEYRYAKEKGIPILVFIISDTAVTLPKNIEKDPSKVEKLEEFKKEAKIGRMVEWWDNKEELARKVMNSLNKQFYKGKRAGWIRAEAFDIEKTQNEIIELNKENRKLKKELEDLKKEIEVRIPKIELSINEMKEIEVPFWERNMKGIELEFLPLEYEDVPDGLGISEKEIDEYNESLPSDEEIKKYKDDILFVERAKKHSTEIDIKISNNGMKKANDIRIELCFPDEIRVFEKTMIKDIEYPNFPMKVENPINKYYREKNNIMIPGIIQNDDYFKYNVSPKHINNLISSVRNISSTNKYFVNDDNSISIRMNNLMHEYEWGINDEYIIVPRKKGEFEIECHIICEEYSREQIQIIPVIVK